MELTETQQTLIDGMKVSGAEKDMIITLMLLLQDNEEGMEELIYYIKDNRPTPNEIGLKALEIAGVPLNPSEQETE